MCLGVTENRECRALQRSQGIVDRAQYTSEASPLGEEKKEKKNGSCVCCSSFSRGVWGASFCLAQLRVLIGLSILQRPGSCRDLKTKTKNWLTATLGTLQCLIPDTRRSKRLYTQEGRGRGLQTSLIENFQAQTQRRHIHRKGLRDPQDPLMIGKGPCLVKAIV